MEGLERSECTAGIVVLKPREAILEKPLIPKAGEARDSIVGLHRFRILPLPVIEPAHSQKRKLARILQGGAAMSRPLENALKGGEGSALSWTTWLLRTSPHHPQ